MPSKYKRFCDRCKNFYVGEGQMYCSRFCADKSNGERIRGANHPMFGKKHTEESLKKMSDKTRGENNPMFGLKGKSHPAFGKHWRVIGRTGKKGKKNPLWGRKSTKITRQKLSDSKRGSRNPMFGVSGSLAPNWRGGVTPINKLIRNSPEYIAWREAVFKRDGWKCRMCPQVGGKLHAHHIKSFSHHKKSRFDVANGLTLCISCHKKTETYGWKSYNWERDEREAVKLALR